MTLQARIHSPRADVRRRHGRRWSAVELEAIRSRYGFDAPAVIAADMGRTVAAIWECANRLGLRNKFDYRTPSREQYRNLLWDECRTAGISYSQALGRSQDVQVLTARRRVFAALRAQGYSFPGIASAAGRDQTTIRYGIQVVNKFHCLVVGAETSA